MIELGTYKIQSRMIDAGRYPDKESFESEKKKTFYEMMSVLSKAVECGDVKIPFEMNITETHHNGWEYCMVAIIRSIL